MTNFTISIFGNKIFLEIINELKLFSKFQIKYYDNFDLCIKDAEEGNLLTIFFLSKKDDSFFIKNEKNNFPYILITQILNQKNIFFGSLNDQIKMPFSIFEFEKKVTSLIAKSLEVISFRENLSDIFVTWLLLYFLKIQFFSETEVYFIFLLYF